MQLNKPILPMNYVPVITKPKTSKQWSNEEKQTVLSLGASGLKADQIHSYVPSRSKSAIQGVLNRNLAKFKKQLQQVPQTAVPTLNSQLPILPVSSAPSVGGRVADLLERLARGVNVQDEIKGNKQQAFVEEEDEDYEEEESEEEEEEEPVHKRVRMNPTKSPLSTIKSEPLAGNDHIIPNKVIPNVTLSLFGYVQEIPRPEIKEHFLLVPHPYGLSVHANIPDNEPQTVLVKLEYSFESAVHGISDVTGDNDARTASLLHKLSEEKKFSVPFVIDDISVIMIEKSDLVIVKLVGKKHKIAVAVKT